MSNDLTQTMYDLQEGGVTAGAYNRQDLDALYKAMSAGSITGRETNDLLTASGAPLKVESLENTLKLLTSQAKHTPFFAKIGKKVATNTVEEYNQLVSNGVFDGGFTIEGELPEEVDSVYRRKAQFVKFLGIVGGVTLPMQLVNTGSGISNLITQETTNKTRKMMELMEYYLPFADSRTTPEHFNGLITQHEMESEYGSYNAYMTSEHVIDLNGDVLTRKAIAQATKVGIDNYGIPDTVIGSPAIFSNFMDYYDDKTRVLQPVQAQRDGVFGNYVSKIITQNGEVNIVQSNFYRNNQMRLSSSVATSSKAPATPAAVSVATSTDALSRIRATDTGDYYYAVAAKNRYGQSALSLSSMLSVAANQAVDITIGAGTGVYPATSFVIYKTKKDPASGSTSPFYKVFEVPATALTTGYDGSTSAVRDRFRFMPGLDEAFVPEWDADQVLAWKQLAPLMKMNLAITAPVSRFMLLLYGTPMLYAPRKCVRIINIGNNIP